MKKLFLFVTLILLVGCSKESFELSLETIVENNTNMVVAINYPVTNIKKLDNEILKYIDSVYDGFKNEYESYYEIDTSSELNIDYKFFKTDKYINIILYTFINSSKLAHPINEIKTFVYDSDLNKIINLNNFLTQEQLEKIVPTLKQKLITKYKDCILMELLTSTLIPDFKNYEYFTIGEDTLDIYFEPYKITSGNCNIISISYDLKDLGINFTKSSKIVFNNYEETTKMIDPYSKVVAITFDDGPSKYTSSIIDILNKYDASATFFVLGNKIEIYKDTISKMIKSGNEIGNHSYNHKWLTRLSIDEFREQVDKTQNILIENFNYTPRLLRPTYGSINRKIRGNTDLEIVLWDVDSLDWKIKDSSKIVSRIIDDIDDLDIVLFHDTHKRTVEAIDKIMPLLKERGFQFVTISELSEIKKIRNN